MRWLAPFGRGRRDRDIADEIQTHLQMAIAERIERGETPDEARRAALREFGNVPLIQQTTRDMWSWTTLEQLVQDVRFGARILWHSPGLSATAVLLVALVIGGNTTIYSIVHGILTSPAHGVTAERLVCIKHVVPGSILSEPYISYPNYRDYAKQSQTIRKLAGWSNERLTVGIDSGSYAVFGALVTIEYFDTFGVSVALGRSLGDDDDRLSGGLVAIISDRFWRERLQAAADVVGHHVTVNGNPATIVGVAAPRFRGATLTPGEDIWLPLGAYYDAIGGKAVLEDRGRSLVLVAGQLAPGVSLSQAQAAFRTLTAQPQAVHPDQSGEHRALVTDYSAAALLPVAEMAPRFLALFSVVTLLTLLIVSANVANLMLARAVVRQRDTAVRQSLGASRVRILRMLVAEGAAMSLTAWGAACLFSWWTSRALVRLLEPAQGVLSEVRPDWAVAAYAIVLAMLATLAFTTVPALRTWRQQVLPWLKAGEQAVAVGRSTLSNMLVVMQLAFSVLLLTSAGLAYRSLAMLDSGDVGFNKDNLLLVTVRAARTGAFVDAQPSAAEREARFALLERVRESLASVGNVEAVSYSRRVPGAYLVRGAPVWRAGQAEPVSALTRPVGPDYLRVLGLSPAVGRDITAVDRRGAQRTAVINGHLANMLWPGQSPIGQTLLVGDAREAVEIVGVAPNALFDGPSHDPRPRFVFVPEQQSAGNPSIDPTFFVRYRRSLDAVTSAIGKAIAQVDADLPIVSMSTMTARLRSVAELERMVATLLTSFAIASLIVAALGQYAISMFNMRRRTRDFGVRLALGASSSQIERAVVREALQLTSIGLGIGFVLSLGVATAAKTVLFGVTPTDPPTYAGVLVLLATASLVASYLPAWRAGRVNVVDALRQE